MEYACSTSGPQITAIHASNILVVHFLRVLGLLLGLRKLLKKTKKDDQNVKIK
jgi:hypothetical protein